MTRKELYEQIKYLGLQDEVKKLTGDNYTRATNSQLELIVKKAITKVKPPTNTLTKCTALNKLIEILTKKKILLKSEVNEIMNV